MARFYDTRDDAELARVEGVLKKGGIEYSCRGSRDDTALKEIMVAEEDMPRAEELLVRSAARCC